MQYSTHLLRHLRFTIGQNIHRRRAEQKMPLKKLARLSDVPERLTPPIRKCFFVLRKSLLRAITVKVYEIFVPFLQHRNAIDIDHSLLQLNCIAGQANNAFDVFYIRLLCDLEYHHISARRNL